MSVAPLTVAARVRAIEVRGSRDTADCALTARGAAEGAAAGSQPLVDPKVSPDLAGGKAPEEGGDGAAEAEERVTGLAVGDG